MGVLWPIVLLLVAVGSAGVFSYGGQPQWVRFAHGLGLILFSRRWEGALIALSLAACLVLVGLVIAGRRRAWWLIGLAPVLALFIHHFATGPFNGLLIADDPRFVPAEQAAHLSDEDWVVGVVWGEAAYAYPFANLYTAPVVIAQDHDHRMILLWSAYANRALAFEVSREVKGRDLEVVSIPADALLLYNRRLGQFINGLTGRVQARSRDLGPTPTGFKNPIATVKLRWGSWKRVHPGTVVLDRPGVAARAPKGPILPRYPTGDGSALPERVTVVGEIAPVAVASERIDEEPMNLVSGAEAYVVFYDPSVDAVRAFDRVLEGGLYTRFVGYHDPARPRVAFRDVDTGSLWTRDGRAVEGERKGTRLKRVPVADGVYWNVMKFWYPDLQVVEGQVGQTETAPAPAPAPAQRPRRRGR